jgi:uncharacterized membrane protein
MNKFLLIILALILVTTLSSIGQEGSETKNKSIEDSITEDELIEKENESREQLLEEERERIEAVINEQQKIMEKQTKIFFIAALCLVLFVTSFIVLIIINRRLRKKLKIAQKEFDETHKREE